VPDGLVLREETPGDLAAISELHTLAFADDGLVARLVDALRPLKTPLPTRSFVAELDGRLAGHVMLSGARLDAPARIVDVLVLSPLGVSPTFQGQGVGERLIRQALEAADRQGAPMVFLEGSPRYYSSRGFEPAAPLGFRAPSLRIPELAFQVARLSTYKPWMIGTLVYAEVFWALDCVGLREPKA
jgi:putative acetyltransferase